MKLKCVLCQTVKAQMKCRIIAAFHLGLHCWLRQKLHSEKGIQIYLEIITSGSTIYTMHHPKCVVLNQKEANEHPLESRKSVKSPYLMHVQLFILYEVGLQTQGGGGYSNFFCKRRLGPSIYRSSPKYIRNFKHPKKIFEIFATPKKYPDSVYLP